MKRTESPAVDPDRASAARVYNYYLGGSQNFDVDREFGERMIAAVPDVPIVARLNRAFLRRAVRTCAEAGIKQFLDIGSGIPGPGSVLDFADSVTPGSRVVYVDNEPVAVQSGRALLAGHPRAAMTWGDIRDPATLLAAPEVARLINLAEPVGLLMLGVLHYVPDEEDPYELVASYRDLIASGSYLVISHGTADARPAPVQAMVDLSAADQDRAYMREASQVERFLDGFSMLPPGVVFLPDWRPDPADDPGTPGARTMAYAAAARKP